MKNSRSLNGLRGLGVPGAILLVAVLAVFAGSRVEIASSGSVVQLTQQPHLLLRQPNPRASSASSQLTNQFQVSAAYNTLPLSFEGNQGQTDPQVKFVSRGSGYTLFLTRRVETVLVLRKPAAKRTPLQSAALASAAVARQTEPASPPAVVRMKLVGASARPRVEGLDELPGKANYFIGNDPKKWRTDVPMYAKVRYREVYPGVDLVYYGNQRQLEHDFIVAPGADLASITMAFEGAEKLSLDAHGDLLLTTENGALRFQKPVVYQEVAGVQQEVAGGYKLKGKDRVGFEVAAYDVTKPVVIDPVLFYSTYMGGSGYDNAEDVAVDTAGNAYVTGVTSSTNFPTTPGAFQTTFAGGSPNGDAFVTKLNPTGSGLVYSTYLGGSGSDTAQGIAVDSAGNAYVTGGTTSTNFPTTPGAFQTTFGGGANDAFVTKVNPTGSGLVYSTYLGGSGFDVGADIALDASGNAYVTGATNSAFPTTPGAFQTTYAGSGDFEAFVTKLSPTGSGVVYSTYIGGSVADQGFGIAVDASGNAYATGYTTSTNFPTTPGAFQTTLRGPTDAFVTKLNPVGSGLIYSSYLGGSDNDVGLGIALDTLGNAHVTGSATSTNFPTTPGAFQTIFGGGAHDAFVTEVNSTGTGLIYSTYLGGSGDDNGDRIALDASGNAYVTGDTNSTNFPTANAVQSALASDFDVFVTKINPLGSGLVYSTYLGGSAYDQGLGIALDSLPNPNAYVSGVTGSINFPTTAGALQTTFGGGSFDAFVAKISEAVVPPPPTVGKVTGGGTVDVTGGIANFGFIVQAQSTTGPIGGDLQYVNHASGAKVHSVMFTTFTISGNTATFSGTCTNNGAPCTFNVTVQDNDQPVGPDSFIISVNGGPPEGGTLRNGDIEIHQ